ncbi:hypothetical protein Tco_0818953 [Tanacetum coccineum]
MHNIVDQSQLHETLTTISHIYYRPLEIFRACTGIRLVHVNLHPSFSVLDYATVFVEYNGVWEYDGKEWFFRNSKSSTIFLPKHITLSEIIDILYEHLDVNKKLYRFNLEVQHGIEYPSKIEYNQDLSVFISETLETKLPLCVTRIYDEISSEVAGERRKCGLPSLKLSLHSCSLPGSMNATQVSFWGGRLHFREVGEQICKFEKPQGAYLQISLL